MSFLFSGDRDHVIDTAIELFGMPKYNFMQQHAKWENGTFVLELDVPGFSKDEVSVHYDKDYLRVEARKTAEKSGSKLRQDFTFSEYVGKLDEASIEASLENGVLVVTGKRTSSKPGVEITVK